MNAYLTALVGAVVTLVAIAELLRRRRLREKYAVLWVVVGLVVLFFAVWPAALRGLADVLGVETPVNLAFFVAALVLLVVSVQLSGEISTLEDKMRVLAEEIGVLRLQLRRLGADSEGTPGAGAGDLDAREGSEPATGETRR